MRSCDCIILSVEIISMLMERYISTEMTHYVSLLWDDEPTNNKQGLKTS